MSVNSVNGQSAAGQIGNGLIKGAGLMLATAPMVNGFNRISVIACTRNIPSIEAARRIYLGVIDSKPASLKHYSVGMTPYLTKESCRILAKSIGFTWFKPQLEQHYCNVADPFGTFKANLIFSSTLSLFEVAINPIDTCCTIWQSGGSVKTALSGQKRSAAISQLYSGAVLNGVRQFGQWIGYSVSEQASNEWMTKYTNIDPHTTLGIALKSWPQALFFTTYIYPFQRFKTEMQCNPNLSVKAKEECRCRVPVVLEHIVTTQSKRGIMRGFWAKVASNSILMFGVSILLEQGRLQLNNKK